MKSIAPTVAAVAAIAAAISAAIAVAATSGAQADPPIRVASQGAGTNAFGGGQTENHFVEVPPCRIADTRLAGGKLEPGASHVFAVRGTSAAFPAQGGTAGGCGIDEAAVAVETTITAVDAGSGFLRAYPADGSPDATFMNYDDAFNVSNTGTLALCEGSCEDEDLRLRPYGTPTHAVVEVSGYYVAPLSIHVNEAGGTIRGSRVATANNTNEGVYEVTFDRDISECAYHANVDLDSDTAWATVTGPPATPSDETVIVGVLEADNDFVDAGFFLTVVC